MKKIFTLTLAICMVLCLFACSNNTETSDVSGESTNEISPDDFECKEVSGGLSIVGYTGAATCVKIPSVINNKKVISIAETAFSGNISVEEIYLPETLSDEFNLDVFDSCDSLKKLHFSGHIEELYSYELSVNEIIFQSLSNKAFENIHYLIYKCKDLTELVINNVADFEYTYFSKIEFENRTVNITIPQNVCNALLEGVSYEYVDFLSDWERQSTKYTLKNNFNDEELFASDLCNSRLYEAFGEANIELTSDIRFWKKHTIDYSETPAIVAISSTIFEGEEHIIEFVLDDFGDEDVLDIEDHQGFYVYPDSYICAKQISNSSNLCIAFGCRAVIVNGTNYSLD